jgi:allantoinase
LHSGGAGRSGADFTERSDGATNRVDDRRPAAWPGAAAVIPRERAPYSAIVDRPPLRLPGGARIAVWTIVNLEFWDISRPMARQVLPAPTGQVLLPDVPNWAWHEYGMRVGVWRFFELFVRLGIRPTVAINARVVTEYERVARAAHEAGWEFMGHGFEQMPIHQVADQKAMIEDSLAVLERFTGNRPLGWLGPGLTETEHTPDLLAAAGVKYIGDWVYDDEPTEIATACGPLVTLPYTVELNDIPMMLVQHHESAYFAQRCRDSFERLYREGESRAKIMAIAIHPYISGQPHRIKYLEAVYEHIDRHAGVLHWNGAEILDWYLASRRRG